MWYGPGRESGRYITGFEPVQRIGVYSDSYRENEDKNRNRFYNGQGKLKGYGTQYYARTSAPHSARFNGPAERVGVCRTVQGVQMEVVGMYFWNS